LIGVQNNLPTPVTYRYSLLAQYDLGHNWVLTAGYQGNVSRHYTRQTYPNLFFTPLNPAVQQYNLFTSDVNGSYNALLTQVQPRFSSSFSIDAQYTFSRAEDNASSDFAIATFPFNPRSEWAPSDFDVGSQPQGLWRMDSAHLPRRACLARQNCRRLDRHRHSQRTYRFPLESRVQRPGQPTRAAPAPAVSSTPTGQYCTVRPAAYLGGALGDYSNTGFKAGRRQFPEWPDGLFHSANRRQRSSHRSRGLTAIPSGARVILPSI